MSLSNNFPAIKPSLNLDFANVKALDPRITFTRTTTATYYGTQTARAEENLLLYSQALATSPWATINAAVTENTEVAPDGTTTAETITDDATSGTHLITQTPVCTAGIPYTFSAFLKEGTNQFGVVLLFSTTANENYVTAIVDLDAGTISKSQSGSSTTNVSTSIVSVGNGWYRVSIVGTAATAFNRARIGLSDSGTPTIGVNGLLANYSGTSTTIFAWGAQLEQRSAVTAYTPTTTQPITNYIPVLETAASGVARFDHNPTTFESLGLLVEEQRTNLLTYSEQFDNAAWTKPNVTILANSSVSPDGALTAELAVPTTSTNDKVIQQSFTYTAGTTYTLSVYAKRFGNNRIRLGIPGLVIDGGAERIAIFDLSAGEVVDGTVTTQSAAIADVGNGWYRCSITQVATLGGASVVRIWAISNTNQTSYAGDGYSGIFIWGAQLE